MVRIYRGRLRLVEMFLTVTFAALCFSPVTLPAEDKAPFDPKSAKDGGLGMPSPFDKFLALDQVLSGSKLDWRKTFQKVAVDIDVDSYNDKDIAIPMVLGVRIADGVMAIKARDAELLNKCASDIEKLAQKMGIKDSELARARAVRAAANNNEWLTVFMELGFLQQDIMHKIEDNEHASRGDLLIVSGWMQGARYTTTIVEDHYSEAASNILREPLLAKALMDKLQKMPDNVKASPAVAKMLEALPKMEKILTIPLDGSISKDNIIELKKLSTDVVKAAVNAGT